MQVIEQDDHVRADPQRPDDRTTTLLSTLRSLLPDRTAVLSTVALWLPMFGWLLLFQPGMVSPDSLSVWNQVRTGVWTDAHPPLYTAAMWVSRAITGDPSLLTALQGLLLAAGIVACARSLIRLGAPRIGTAVVATVLAWSPMIGAFSVSLWKDVPYAGAFLFAAARSVDLITAHLRGAASTRAVVSLAVWSSALVLLRQNGFLLVGVLLVGLIVGLPGRRRQLLICLACPILVLAVAKFVVYPAVGIRPADSNVTIANLLHDIAAQIDRDPDALRPHERAALEQLAPLEVWSSTFRTSGCWSQNWQFDPRFRWDRVSAVRGRLVKTWARLALEHPIVELRNRACVSAIAWSPFPVGPSYTVERAVAPNDDGLKLQSISDAATSRAVDLLTELDRQPAQAVLWRAPGWMLLAAASVATAAFRARRPILLMVLLPLGAFVASVAPVVPSQDARYMMPALMLAVLMLPVGWRRPAPTDQRDAGTGASPRRTGP